MQTLNKTLTSDRRTRRIATLASVCLVFTMAFGVLVSAGQDPDPAKLDLQAFVRETQKSSQVPGEVTLVWWLPEQFWRASLQVQQERTLTAQQADEFLKTLRPYLMIAVLDGRMGSFGSATFKTEDEIRAGVTVKDAKGGVYMPLKDAQITPEVKILVGVMKPLVANLIGAMGQNMHFLLFPAESSDGQPIADAKSDRAFSVLIGQKEFAYRLPLASVLPPRYDSATGERFPGNYVYNPFTGAKLITR
jgi:hypothetical protein